MSYLQELRKLVGHRPLLSAGATVLVIRDQKVLLNLRADTHTWGIPGGGMEPCQSRAFLGVGAQRLVGRGCIAQELDAPEKPVQRIKKGELKGKIA